MDAKNFDVALMQLRPAGSLQANLEKGLLYSKLAKLMGADMALFPEMWSNGYSLWYNKKKGWWT